MSGVVRDLIDEWLRGPDPLNLSQMVRTFRALPVYSDLGGTLFIREDGEILVSRDSREPPELETQRQWRIVALTQGAAKFPVLAELLPQRADSDEDCISCGGGGRVVVGAADLLCGKCLGLGWTSEAFFPSPIGPSR